MEFIDKKIILTTIGLMLCGAAFAQLMSSADRSAQKDSISANSKAANAACMAFAGNAHDICTAKARGRENVAQAELEATYKPGRESSYGVRVAIAEATYSVARQKCDDQVGNLKDGCVQEAEAAQTTAKAEAGAQMNVVGARGGASEEAAVARIEAAVERENANYAVAIEKCGAFAADVKSRCVADANATYGRS